MEFHPEDITEINLYSLFSFYIFIIIFMTQ